MNFLYSAFISYPNVTGSSIEKLVDRLGKELAHRAAAHGVYKNVFRDSYKLRGGDDLDEKLPEAMRRSLVFIKVLAPSYYRRDDNNEIKKRWCQRESVYADAIAKNRMTHCHHPNVTYIFPIALIKKPNIHNDIFGNNVIIFDFNEFNDEPTDETFKKYIREIEHIAGMIENASLHLEDKMDQIRIFSETFPTPDDERVIALEAAYKRAALPDDMQLLSRS